MEHSKLRGYVETSSSVAVILVAVVVIGSYARQYIAPAPAMTFQSGLQKGQPFTLLPRVDYSRFRQTIVIALDSQCRFCNESVPFYKRLTESLPATDSTQVVSIFPESEGAVQKYLEQTQLKLEAVSGVDFKALNLAATPTIVLVDSRGKVADFWIGRPSEHTERQILNSLTN